MSNNILDISNYSNLSPMMRQYFEIKKNHQDCILFFRLGDFYEMFYHDAELVSKTLEITLTGRDCGLSERAPMCGIPHHSSEAYIKRLIDKGFKIAICEQTEEFSGKGIVSRDVVRIITPGTIIDSSMIDESLNNYICSLYMDKDNNRFGISFADVSTGELHVGDFSDENLDQVILNEIAKFSPVEILFNYDCSLLKKTMNFLKTRLKCAADVVPDDKYNMNFISNIIKNHFNQNIKEIENYKIYEHGIISLGVLIDYVNHTQKQNANKLININYYNKDGFLQLDINARRNLEITETIINHQKEGSLLWCMDTTKTSMGRRLIRKYIGQPLINKVEILNRLAAVNELFCANIHRTNLINLLDNIYDLERLITKIVYSTISPRELKSLEYVISSIPKIKNITINFKSKILEQIHYKLDDLENVKQIIQNSIEENASNSFKDGGVIKLGYNQELDEYKNLFYNAKNYIADIELREREQTKIKNLKVRYNKILGYYIEVTKSNVDLIPSNYIRRQTLSNSERYITTELKELESKVIFAEERMKKLENELYFDILKQILQSVDVMQSTATSIAQLDVFCCFADIAVKNNYVCPEVTYDSVIQIKDGRHPVVEKLCKDNDCFVPNDTYLDDHENKIGIITGPNMSGKSTYMRQVAIICIMAQAGSFVPAEYARIGIVDKIFTRVGASDDLSAGRSTFMVEMSEMADILINATSQSLVILDEVGRGTSTFDGISIAKAVLEYIIKASHLGNKTLFATHYHELTELEKDFICIKNYSVAVKRDGDSLTFLRKIIPGAADDSYGIEVAKLAGVPDNVVQRAKQILSDIELSKRISFIEKSEHSEEKLNTDYSPQEDHNNLNIAQNDSYGYEKDTEVKNIIDSLKCVDINQLSPLEAFNIIRDIKNKI